RELFRQDRDTDGPISVWMLMAHVSDCAFAVLHPVLKEVVDECSGKPIACAGRSAGAAGIRPWRKEFRGHHLPQERSRWQRTGAAATIPAPRRDSLTRSARR